MQIYPFISIWMMSLTLYIRNLKYHEDVTAQLNFCKSKQFINFVGSYFIRTFLASAEGKSSVYVAGHAVLIYLVWTEKKQ